MAKIEPTVGRVLWYYPQFHRDEMGREPLSASIAAVNNNGTVNIGFLSQLGVHHNALEVPIWDGQGPRPIYAYCEWMPYQKGQAAKTEALEAKLAGGA